MPAGLEARRRGLRASYCVSGCCCFSGRVVDGVKTESRLLSTDPDASHAGVGPARTLKIVAALRLALHAQKGHRALLRLHCVHVAPPTVVAVRNSPRLPFARLRTCPEGSTQDLREPRPES